MANKYLKYNNKLVSLDGKLVKVDVATASKISEEKTVIPSTTQQIITPTDDEHELSKVTVNAVTSAIDSNIQAQNIKKDVTILDVTGTLEDINLTVDYDETSKTLTITDDGGGSDEWKPNPTWWDIEKILAEDTRDYPYKVILLLKADEVVEDKLKFFKTQSGYPAYATSDGAFYEGYPTANHTWDTSKDKPCIIDGEEQYKTRYVILYAKNMVLDWQVFRSVIYMVGNIAVGQGNFRNLYNMQSAKLASASCYQNFENSGIETIAYTDTSQATSCKEMFSGCMNLKTIPLLDLSNCTNFGSMFHNCYSLRTIPLINTIKGTDVSSMFVSCYNLETIPLLDTSNSTSCSQMFYDCRTLKTVPSLNVQNCENFNRMFGGCRKLFKVGNLNTENGTNFREMFYNCSSIGVAPELDTKNGTNFNEMFSGCSGLATVPKIDIRNATSVSNMFAYCYQLNNLNISNIKISLQISSGTSWGNYLKLESLLYTIKELHDNTNGTSTLTLTVGSANLTKLANVYVKLVDITDEMRAEDEFIDNKKPFVVCESTDEGAMLITEYVTSKNWQLA